MKLECTRVVRLDNKLPLGYTNRPHGSANEGMIRGSQVEVPSRPILTCTNVANNVFRGLPKGTVRGA